MGSRGAAATLDLQWHLMVVATLTLAAATFMSTAEAGCSESMAQQVTSTSGRFRVPEGGKDGIYMGSVEVDEQGVEQYRVKFLGEGNTTLDAYGAGTWANNLNNVNVSRPGPGGLGRKLLQQDSGAHCQFNLLDPYSVLAAVTQVANYFGPGGNTMPAREAWFAVDACTVAYICNYNNGALLTNSIRIWTDTASINAVCTVNSGGFYSRETSNSATGRTYLGNTFC